MEEPLDGFAERFAAEGEGLVVHGEETLGARLVGHAPGLLWRAMSADPWVVSTDGHEGEVERARGFQAAEEIGVGRVTGKEHAAGRAVAV